MALGISDATGYALGFRCSNDADLALVYLTPERLSAEVTTAGLAKMSSVLGTKLLVVVDDAGKVEFDALPERVDIKGSANLRFISSVDGLDGLLAAVKSAKRRVAITANFMGKNYHTRSFDVRGSRKALEALEAGCKLGATN